MIGSTTIAETVVFQITAAAHLRLVAENLLAGLVVIVDVAVEAVADFGYANVVVSATKRSHLEAIQAKAHASPASAGSFNPLCQNDQIRRPLPIDSKIDMIHIYVKLRLAREMSPWKFSMQ